MAKRRYDWETTAKELREEPDAWAIVVDSGVAPSKRAAQDVARYIRNGSRYMPKGEFTATSRGDRVFAKYIGELDNAGD